MTPLSMIGYIVILGIIAWTIYGSITMNSMMSPFGMHLGGSGIAGIVISSLMYIAVAYVVFFALPKYLSK